MMPRLRRSTRSRRSVVKYDPSDLQPATKKSINISELVYRYLSDVAAREAEKKRSTRGRIRNPRSKIQNPRKISSKRVTRRDERLTSPSKSTDSRLTTSEHSSIATATSNETLNQGSSSRTKRAKKKENHRPFMQMFKNIKNRFEEGTQKAKTYVKKALWFAVDSGYLIPDRRGKILHLSPSLSGFNFLERRTEPEARRQRRNMRRGGGKLERSERKALRKKTTPPRSCKSPSSNTSNTGSAPRSSRGKRSNTPSSKTQAKKRGTSQGKTKCAEKRKAPMQWKRSTEERDEPSSKKEKNDDSISCDSIETDSNGCKYEDAAGNPACESRKNPEERNTNETLSDKSDDNHSPGDEEKLLNQ